MGRLQDLFGRVARRPQPTAFVLGGGGNLGATQVGMLKALTERGVVADVVIGCSVGAINGAAYAGDPTVAGVLELERVWRSIQSRDLAPANRLPVPVQLVRRGISLHSNEGLRLLIERFVGAETFDELQLPLHCLATSLDHGEERWFTEGPLVEALLASSAIPAVYPPVEIDGERFIDGAAIADVPVRRAGEIGAGRIYVLPTGNLDRPRIQPRRPLDVAIEASWIARAAWYRQTLVALPKGIDVVVLPAGETPVLRYYDFSRTGELIDRAHDLSSRFLDGAAVVEEPEEPEPTVEDSELLA